MSGMNAKARFALLLSMIAALFLACSGDDNGGGPNGPLGDGGPDLGDGSSEAGGPCNCTSVACQGAPPLDPTVVASFYQANRFIYEGVASGQCVGQPLQSGVAAGTIDPKRAAAVLGKVTDEKAQPVAGVTVTIVAHPEFGQTISAPDGTFIMVVNGGGPLTARYAKAGSVTVQRHARTRWLDYAHLPDVVLRAASATSTAVTLGSVSAFADGDSVTDTDGTRAAHVYFAPNTTANVVAANGTKTALSSFHLRMTELTSGATGPQSMPADLPPTSAYTYCTSFDIDEAPNAARVEFNPPAITYVDNFLSFKPGTIVPDGAYRPDTDDWETMPSGVVLQVLTINGGTATVDADGDGKADSPAQLSAIGMTSDELGAIAGKFSAGASIWRVSTAHFTKHDFNLAAGLPAGAMSPNAGAKASGTDASTCSGGSIIGCENQSLGEALPVAGTGLSLMYSTERTRGYAPSRSVEVQLTDATMPSTVSRITLDVDVAGEHFSQEFPAPTPNLKTVFTWDGKDILGRPLQGAQPVKFTTTYWYDADYTSSTVFSEHGTNIYIVTKAGASVPTRQQIGLGSVSSGTVTAWDERGFGLGGWLLQQHHVFDPSRNIVFFGNGTKQSVETLGNVSFIAAGQYPGGSRSGDGGPATAATFNSPHGIAVTPEGIVFIADELNHVIRKIDTTGIITTFAGTGTPGFSGDGGPATSAQLQNPMGLALGNDGTLYVADFGNARVRKIAPTGVISTVAGTGTKGSSGDYGPATTSLFEEPHALALGPDQSLYITDTGACTVRRVLPNGVVVPVSGTGTSGKATEDGPALTSQLGYPSGIAIGAEGSVFVADRIYDVVWRITPDGRLVRFAGTPGSYGQTGDGGFAKLAQLSEPHSIDVGDDLSVYITDEGNGVVRKVDTAGIISTIAGDGTSRKSGVSPLDLFFGLPRVTKVNKDGSIWLADYSSNLVFRISPARPLVVGSTYVIPTRDGRNAFVFDFNGRHLKTVDAVTGVALLTFGYDGLGRVQSIADRDGNTTTIARDSSGNPASITSPWGHVTTLAVDGNGYLQTATDATGAATSYATSPDGLLQSQKQPNGDLNTFTYDADGRLTKDAEPWGGFKTLARTDITNGWSVGLTTAQGRVTTHDIQQDDVTGETRTTHLPDGNQAVWNRAPSQAMHVTLENKAVMQTTAVGDPRFDMMAPVTASGSYATPLGNGVTVAQLRAVTPGSANDPTAPATFSEASTWGGNTWTQSYDAATRTWIFTSPTGRTEQVALDAKGHVVEVDAPNRAPARAAYDGQGRVTSITQDTRSAGFTYDARSNLASSTDPLSHTWSYGYDAVGRATAITRADSQKIGISYDVNGNVTSVTPPGKAAHDFTYTAGDVPKAYKPPPASGTASNDTLYAFSQDLDLATLTRADGQVVGLGYDTAGRLASTTSSAGVSSIAWIPTTGELGSVSDPDGEAIAFTTDGGLLLGATWTGPVVGAVSYAYDTSLRVATETAGGTAVNYGYDGDSLLTTAGSESLTRNANDGYLSGTSLGAASDARTYSQYGELATYAASISGTAIFSQNFTRDGLGRVSSLVETIDGATHTYGYSYDLADRLATVTIDGAASSSYSYDANGNATAATVRGVAAAGVYDAQDRVTSYGGATFDWTAQGELLGKHEGVGTTSYATDSLGRLQSVSLPTGHVVSYVYDGSNRRVGKKLDGVLVQGFLYHDGIKPIVELDGAGSVVARFVYGTNPILPDYVIRGGNTYRIFADQLGSPRVVADVSSGAVVERIDYDERGNTLKDTNAGFIPFGFAGGIVDRDTGFVRFGARDYDSATERWTARDLVGVSKGSNAYQYVHNDPINYYDRFGHDGEALDGGFWGSFASAAGRLGTAIDGILSSGAVYTGSALATGSAGVALGILGGGVFISEGTDDPTADDEGGGEGGSCPSRPFPGWDPALPPGEGWQWHGPDPPGGPRGGWVNPDEPRESLHPDLGHGGDDGPHWDWNTPGGGRLRIYPDGSIRPK